MHLQNLSTLQVALTLSITKYVHKHIVQMIKKMLKDKIGLHPTRTHTFVPKLSNNQAKQSN